MSSKRYPEEYKREAVRQLTHPARLVSLLSRLWFTVKPRSERESPQKGLQDALSIAQFRREIHNGLKKDLEELCEGNVPVRAVNILEATWGLLTNGDWSLPPVLASNITAH